LSNVHETSDARNAYFVGTTAIVCVARRSRKLKSKYLRPVTPVAL